MFANTSANTVRRTCVGEKPEIISCGISGRMRVLLCLGERGVEKTHSQTGLRWSSGKALLHAPTPPRPDWDRECNAVTPTADYVRFSHPMSAIKRPRVRSYGTFGRGQEESTVAGLTQTEQRISGCRGATFRRGEGQATTPLVKGKPQAASRRIWIARGTPKGKIRY
jgi:hypothetical protein